MSILSKSKMAAIAINKSLLKEYKTGDDARVVYMNNGDEFQIQLFNPTQNVIGAEISINSDKLSGLIVLKPGERIWLERYLDTAKKFKFSTYEVDGNDSEVLEAIKNNGEVKICFYKEKKRDSNGVTITISSPLNEPWNGYTTRTSPYLINSSGTGDMYNKSFTHKLTDAVNDIGYGTTISNSAILNCNAKIKSCTNTTNSINNVTYSTNLKDSDGFINMKDCDESSLMFNYSNPIETGRIDEGSYSNQTFKTVNNDFESWSFETDVIKILPASRKPYSSSDLQKVYCTECGRKLNPKHKFCPYCGTKVE